MLRVLAVVALIWLALMPPLFTGGACTAEFDREAARLSADMSALMSPQQAQAYWHSRGVSSSLVSADQCRRARPSYIDACGRGATVYAVVPVQDRICRFYRDGGIRIQLVYDGHDSLARTITDMNPYHSLPLPWGGALHWGR